MIPDLEVRTISIQTSWPGATPQDVEKEILIEQEEYLRTLPNLRTIGIQRIERQCSYRARLSLWRRYHPDTDRGQQCAEPGADLSGECGRTARFTPALFLPMRSCSSPFRHCQEIRAMSTWS